jgi:hypothetical protein
LASNIKNINKKEADLFLNDDQLFKKAVSVDYLKIA